MTNQKARLRPHSEEFYKRLEKAGIKHVPAGSKPKTTELGATKHLGGKK